MRLFFLLLLIPFGFTLHDYREPPPRPESLVGPVDRELIRDRRGARLTSTYENKWNEFDQARLSDIPEFLQRAFLTSEDQRFYQHRGVDWLGRGNALLSAMKSGRIHRGASTITEQVVRMLTPRSRNFWSRWIETWEAYALEMKWDKASILEFYLNQVPFGGQRRGVSQASRYYFGRDLGSLNPAEMLSLAVLVRAPTFLDPHRNQQALLTRIEWLGLAMDVEGELKDSLETSLHSTRENGLELSQRNQVEIVAPHFSNYVRQGLPEMELKHGLLLRVVDTTLDGHLQLFSQELLNNEIEKLKGKNVNHGALLIVDHTNGDILTWAVSKGTEFNTVLVPRQPGSALKPFLYALALEKAWTPASLIVDEPLITAVGLGVHAIRNYSRQYYGALTLREALGNSLNTPAIKTIKYVGPQVFYEFLKKIGLSRLEHSVDYYGEGLALGISEVSLYKLVQAFTVFSNEGRLRPLRWLKNWPSVLGDELLNPLAVSQVAHILSDPKARLLEFGSQSILNFPYPTSVKTGTATDFRDAWAIGFDSRYVVGVWMGDLERRPTDGNTGARGPALILRSVFNQLNQQNQIYRAPKLHPDLVPQEICKILIRSESPDSDMNQTQVVPKESRDCQSYTEYFIPGTELKPSRESLIQGTIHSEARISYPLPHMQLAWDPRLPPESQALELKLENINPNSKIRWWVNEKLLGETPNAKILWPISRGRFQVSAQVISPEGKILNLRPVPFLVK